MGRALDTLFADLPARLSVEQLTEVLGLSEKTVTYRWLREGRIPAIRLGGTWIIFRDDIKEHLEVSYNTNPGFTSSPSPSEGEQPFPTAPESKDDNEDQEVSSVLASTDENKSSKTPSDKRGEQGRIRQWARDNGYNPSSNGRLHQSIVDAYNEAQK